MSENRKIAKAAGTVGALTLVSRVTGLARDIVIGSLFGSSTAADAFFVAFRIPNLLRRFVAEGAMSAVFVPVFTRSLRVQSGSETLQLAGVLLAGMIVGLLGLTGVGIVFASLWVPLLAPGFATQPGQTLLTTQLTRWLFPYVFLIGLVALLGGLLNAMRRFFAPALAPILLNASIITCALTLASVFDNPVSALVVGVLLGGTLQLGCQWVALWRHGIVLRPIWKPTHPVLPQVGLLLLPTVFGAAAFQLNVIVGTVFASMLAPGSVSFLWYADRIFEFPLGLVAAALGTAALPSLSAQALRGAHGEMRGSVAFALGAAGFVMVPASVGLFLLPEPIIAVLFERGAFGATEVRMTARALQMFAVGLWPVAAVRILVPAFYALGDTRTPALAASVAFVSNLLFSLMLIGPLHGTLPPTGGLGLSLVWLLDSGVRILGVADLQHAGLALSTSLAAAVNFFLLTILLRRRLRGLELRSVFESLVRSVVASAAMAAVLLLAAAHADAAGGVLGRFLSLASLIAAGCLTYVAIAHLLGSRHTRFLIAEMARRLRGARRA